jgi:hypothetical protein
MSSATAPPPVYHPLTQLAVKLGEMEATAEVIQEHLDAIAEGQEPQHFHEQVRAWAKELRERLGELGTWVESEAEAVPA